jgi:hypothetical protein
LPRRPCDSWGRSIEMEHGELGHDIGRSSAAVSCRCALRRAPDVTPTTRPRQRKPGQRADLQGLSRPTWDRDRGGPDRRAGSAPHAVLRQRPTVPPLIADRRRGELPPRHSGRERPSRRRGGAGRLRSAGYPEAVGRGISHAPARPAPADDVEPAGRSASSSRTFPARGDDGSDTARAWSAALRRYSCASGDPEALLGRVNNLSICVHREPSGSLSSAVALRALRLSPGSRWEPGGLLDSVANCQGSFPRSREGRDDSLHRSLDTVATGGAPTGGFSRCSI